VTRMTSRTAIRRLGLLGAVSVLTSAPARGQPAADAARAPRAERLLEQPLPAMRGDSLTVTVLEVTYAPGGTSAPHVHPCPVFGYVAAGALRMQFKGLPERVYRAGETDEREVERDGTGRFGRGVLRREAQELVVLAEPVNVLRPGERLGHRVIARLQLIVGEAVDPDDAVVPRLELVPGELQQDDGEAEERQRESARTDALRQQRRRRGNQEEDREEYDVRAPLPRPLPVGGAVHARHVRGDEDGEDESDRDRQRDARGVRHAQAFGPVVSLTTYTGRSMLRLKIRARYSPMMPRAKSWAPEKMAMMEARKGKPATLVPVTK